MNLLQKFLFLALLVLTPLASSAISKYKHSVSHSDSVALCRLINTDSSSIEYIFAPLVVNDIKYAAILTKPIFDSTGKRFNDEDAQWESFCFHLVLLDAYKEIWKKILPENSFMSIVLMDNPKKVLIKATGYAGGSGYGGNVYSLEPDTKEKLIPLLTQGELNTFYVEDGYILRMKSIWTIDESHTSAHQQELYKCTFLPNGHLKETKLGKTRYKYDYDDNGNPLDWAHQLKHREPTLVKKLGLKLVD